MSGDQKQTIQIGLSSEINERQTVEAGRREHDREGRRDATVTIDTNKPDVSETPPIQTRALEESYAGASSDGRFTELLLAEIK